MSEFYRSEMLDFIIYEYTSLMDFLDMTSEDW